jgi:NADPH:quinone reductase-like Zn-dependent oxidoreductase
MKISTDRILPKKMNALILKEFGQSLEVQEVDVPLPQKGDILVKIDSFPINPSDNSFLKGNYSSKKTLPVVAGFEGSGTVVAAGSDFMSKRLLGKNVACFAPPHGDGTWAEYMVTKSSLAIPLKKNMDLEQGAMLMVNPLSVIAMLDIAKKAKCLAIANTAAASALGQMLNRMCIDRDLPLVNIVRRNEQEELLKSQGAKYVINSSDANFKEALAAIFHDLKVSIAFDAVAGKSTFDLMEALPPAGEVMVYGGLSEQTTSIHPGALIFENKKVSGFWLSDWITHQPMLKLLRSFNRIQKVFMHDHKTTVHQRVSLKDTQKGVSLYLQNMTAGKILVKPGME